MTTELQQKITEIETKLNEMRAQLAAMPDEPVTPVKWVPKVGKNYFYTVGPPVYATARKLIEAGKQ